LASETSWVVGYNQKKLMFMIKISDFLLVCQDGISASLKQLMIQQLSNFSLEISVKYKEL
jgi:hypothetical protein